MTWENEKALYTSKLQRLIDGIDKIQELKGNRIVTPDMFATLLQKRNDAQRLLSKIQKGEFEISVVGLEKAGKSSFSNALIGLNVLPTDDQRCTYTSTCIREGTEDSARICFYTRDEFNRDFHEKLEKLGVKDANLYKIDTLELDKYEQLYENCSDEKKRLYEDSLNQDIRDTLTHKTELMNYIGRPPMNINAEELAGENFRSFITNPAHAIAVKDVTIFSTELKEMPNAIMYDVPGFNSPTQMHREQTLQKMRSSDAIIMVARANEPSITSDVLTIFKESDADGEILSDKLFVFSNKADLATNLKTNMQVTYEEWINKRKILPEKFKDRIVFGSANAHLGDTVPNGLVARKKLEELGYSDGIDDLRDKLKKYYETERFEVLKKRIDKILYDVKNIFTGLNEEYDSVSSINGNMTFAEIIMDEFRKLREALPPKLQDLKDNLNETSRSEKPLTHRIGACIDNLVTEDNFSITDEEIQRIHKEIAGVGAAEQPQKLDSKIRENRFDEMYDAFTHEILACTTTRHREVCHDILQIFMDNLNLSTDSPEYQTFRDSLCELLHINDTANDEYYRSLMERFARDLFEIQIKFTQGTDRLNKFQEEKANFFSLGIFYNASTTGQDEESKLDYIENSPQDSSLWRIFLYPEIASAPSRNDVINKFKELTKFSNVNHTLRVLLDKLMRAYRNDTINQLVNLMIGINFSGPEAVVLSAVKNKLTEAIDSAEIDTDTSSLLNDILTSNRYQNDIASKHTEYTYQTVKDEFNSDIAALRNVLQNAFIPAVNLDKAFSARESKMLEDIIRKIDTKEFERFIRENIYLIQADSLHELESAQNQLMLNQAVMNQIRDILDKINENN